MNLSDFGLSTAILAATAIVLGGRAGGSGPAGADREEGGLDAALSEATRRVSRRSAPGNARGAVRRVEESAEEVDERTAAATRGLDLPGYYLG